MPYYPQTLAQLLAIIPSGQQATIPLMGRSSYVLPPPVPTTTLNPSDIQTSIALTNGNLTATGNAINYNGVRSIASASSGKKYWEFHADAVVTGAGSITEGFASGTATLTTYLGNSTSVGWSGGGNVYGIAAGVAEVWAVGDTLCFALDIDALKVWFRRNGGNWNNDIIANQNPATGTGGFVVTAIGAGVAIFACCQSDSIGDAFTANFGGTAYAQTPPTGFGNW